jgi:hypothetical protein
LGSAQVFAAKSTLPSKTTINEPNIGTSAKPNPKFGKANQAPAIERKSAVDPGAISIAPIKVRITSPASGQALKAGRTYNVCWDHSSVATERYGASARTICRGQGSGLSALSPLKECSEGNGSFNKLFENKPAKGCHSWTIPSDHFPYTYYLEVRLDSTQSDKWTRDEIGIAIEQ